MIFFRSGSLGAGMPSSRAHPPQRVARAPHGKTPRLPRMSVQRTQGANGASSNEAVGYRDSNCKHPATRTVRGALLSQPDTRPARRPLPRPSLTSCETAAPSLIDAQAFSNTQEVQPLNFSPVIGHGAKRVQTSFNQPNHLLTCTTIVTLIRLIRIFSLKFYESMLDLNFLESTGHVFKIN